MGAMPSPARILAVCTGNICRSPAIERLLAARLDGVEVSSAGTYAVVGQPMSVPMAHLVEAAGASARGFTARQLTPALLDGVDLVVTAAREHRAAVVEIAPALVRRTFTLLELARLLTAVPPEGTTTAERLLAVPAAAARARTLVQPGDDDVVDPIGRPAAVYRRSLDQMLPAVDAIAAALSGVPGR
jgi:protein-tyrosine phosphatase